MQRYSPLTRSEGRPIITPARAETRPARGSESQKENPRLVIKMAEV